MSKLQQITRYSPARKTLHTWEAIRDAVADAHKHDTYLNLDQLASAIVAGLAHWGHAGVDGTVLAERIKELCHE